MFQDDSDSKPQHRSFELTPRRKVTGRQRIADAAIILSLVALLAGATVICSCPSFFVVMGVFALVALVYGSRLQRLFSTALLLVAIGGFIHEFRAEQRMAEQIRRMQEHRRQQSQ